ncbi:YdcH family protein [Sphingomonas jaspsi]|uniref:YdcH family protein n=1 Tax=Sphingomonas jaspsi TaxID=392409 RepID=UPI0004B15DEE|nr:YdcH family protein [Sphingomonas jaspsi]
MSSRLFRLTEIHQRIDDALRREQRRRFPDLFRMIRLKKLKLRTKDLIHHIVRSGRPKSPGRAG